MAGTKVIETKPNTFANGVPKEEHNGFFGDEMAEKVLGLGTGTQITAIVTYRVEDDITKRGKGVRYSVLAIDHIEPIWDEKRADQAKALQVEQYTERTGQNQLDFSGAEGGES